MNTSVEPIVLPDDMYVPPVIHQVRAALLKHDRRRAEQEPDGTFMRDYVPGECFPYELVGCRHMFVVLQGDALCHLPLGPYRIFRAYYPWAGDTWHFSEIDDDDQLAALRAAEEEDDPLVMLSWDEWEDFLRPCRLEQEIIDVRLAREQAREGSR